MAEIALTHKIATICKAQKACWHLGAASHENGSFLWCLQFSLDVNDARNKSQQQLREFTFNMENDTVTQRLISNTFGDFPSIPRHLAG